MGIISLIGFFWTANRIPGMSVFAVVFAVVSTSARAFLLAILLAWLFAVVVALGAALRFINRPHWVSPS